MRSRAGGRRHVYSVNSLLTPSAMQNRRSRRLIDYMRLVVYDLLGALFAPPAPLGSRHNDKLFRRVCGIIKGPLCRSGHLSARGGCRDGNFAALFAEAVHGPRVDMQSPHIFAPS